MKKIHVVWLLLLPATGSALQDEIEGPQKMMEATLSPQRRSSIRDMERDAYRSSDLEAFQREPWPGSTTNGDGVVTFDEYEAMSLRGAARRARWNRRDRSSVYPSHVTAASR